MSETVSAIMGALKVFLFSELCTTAIHGLVNNMVHTIPQCSLKRSSSPVDLLCGFIYKYSHTAILSHANHMGSGCRMRSVSMLLKLSMC